MQARLLLDALAGVDQQQRGFGVGGAGDHVLDELAVAGRVDDDVVALRGLCNQICAVSMVMPWSRSDWKASIRKAHSNGMPRRSHIALMASSLPSGSEPVSWNRRPTSVDLP